jgi:Alginate export
VEIGRHASRTDGSSPRLGRQEIVLGSGRLFDNNEGPNVKLSFDGARFITESSKLRWDNFIAKPVQNNAGFFDDTPNHAQTTWGSYLTVHPHVLRSTGVDLYYLGLASANAAYDRGTANEVRHTLGVRAFRDATLVSITTGSGITSLASFIRGERHRSVRQARRLGRCQKIDPNLAAMLASGYGVSSSPLLSLRPTPRRVSCDTLRDS